MKKLFNKILAGVISVTLVAVLALGVSFTDETKADAVTLGKWSFLQGGPLSEAGNEGKITSVALSSGETIAPWESGEITKNATQAATGFDLQIANTGWDRHWAAQGYDPETFNPWSVSASVSTAMMAKHIYKVSFKASANKTKDVYVGFSTVVDGHEMPPYDQAPLKDGSSTQTNVILPTEQTYTYIFTNYVGGQTLKTTLMLGAFGVAVDYAGNDVSDIISPETGWNGTVHIKDFAVEDLGPDPDDPPGPVPPTIQPTTKAPTPTVKPTPKTLDKVKGVKVKSVKKKTIKVSWKKVKNAKKYEIKVNNKTYKASKNSRKIKNKKFKKRKKVKVKVRAMATGYKTGAWSKTVKKKITK